MRITMNRHLTLLLGIALSLLISLPLRADWVAISETADGNRFYVDLERIRSAGETKFSWVLIDYLKPDSDGYWSGKIYQEVDCRVFRFRGLSYSFHKQQMGKDTGEDYTPDPSQVSWEYVPLGSAWDRVLTTICDS